MSFSFLCLCPLGLAAKLNFNISKVVYSLKEIVPRYSEVKQL